MILSWNLVYPHKIFFIKMTHFQGQIHDWPKKIYYVKFFLQKKTLWFPRQFPYISYDLGFRHTVTTVFQSWLVLSCCIKIHRYDTMSWAFLNVFSFNYFYSIANYVIATNITLYKNWHNTAKISRTRHCEENYTA